MYSTVERTEVAAYVDVPPVGTSAITSDCHATLPEVMFAVAALYNLVVVTKYKDWIPLPRP